MGKKCILVNECSIGDIIAQKIVSKYGATIAVENTVVNNYILKKLLAFDIEYVWVYKDSSMDSSRLHHISFMNLKQNYKENVIEISNLINDLCKGKPIKEEKITDVVKSIYCSIDEEYYIVKCINELKSTDQYLYNHSINVSFYAMLLGKWLGLCKSEIEDIVQAGLLHDIGKTKISLSILNKPAKLDLTEYDEMKRHPIYGYNIVKDFHTLSDKVKDAILNHHERVNKSGYPMNKSGDELSLYSKIISLVDAYDAITSQRIYSKRRTPFEAFEILMTECLGCYDIHVMNVFLGNLAACYVGSKVLLNTDEIGEIVYVPPYYITKPIITVNSQYIDLSKETTIKIVSML